MRISKDIHRLFIDEIHRCAKIVSEFLYPVMEDFRCDIGKETKMTMDLPRFTLIGATTKGGSLPPPLYDRFITKFHLSFYDVKDLVKLLKMSAAKLNMSIGDDSLEVLASASRGTPRIANSHLLWLRDFCIDLPNITLDSVNKSLKLSGVETNGIDNNDRKYLSILDKFYPNPVGFKTLQSIMGMGADTLSEVIEPFLVRKGIVQITPKGRMRINNPVY